MIRYGSVCSAAAFALAALPAVAACLGPDWYRDAEAQLFIENDVLAGTDRYYSNGFKVGGGIRCDALQLPAYTVLKALVEDDDTVQFGLFLGQNLYTPRDIRIAAPQPTDRPWAGWLYLGGVAQVARGDVLHTTELDIGLVGPAALGEQTQRNWHRLIGRPLPQGWDNQLPNELAFQLGYLGKRRLRYGEFELIPHAGLTLGTTSTLVRAGALLRVGRNMSGFGPDSIEPGGAMLQKTRRPARDDEARAPWEWYVFAGVDHRFVAYNIFLDGTVFRDSGAQTALIERRVHVSDQSFGGSLRWRDWRLSLTRIRRSPEFDVPTGAGGGSKYQTFDSLNLSYEF